MEFSWTISESGAGAEAKTWRSKAAQMMEAQGHGVLVSVVAILTVRFLQKRTIAKLWVVVVTVTFMFVE